MLILGIGAPNVFASGIASLNLTGNGNTILPTPTPNPSIYAPLNVSGADTDGNIIVDETIPTIQQLATNNPNVSSIIVNFSSDGDIEAEYDEDEQRLSIEITEAEPEERVVDEETEEVGDEEQGDDGEDDDNGIGNGNGNDNDNDIPSIRLPGLPEIDLSLPRELFD
jgi:hypothetical protein